MSTPSADHTTPPDGLGGVPPAAASPRPAPKTTLFSALLGPCTVLGWIVADLESEIDRLAAAGIRFNRYTGMDQHERGIWTAPDGNRVAWFNDPDGNNLSLQS